MRGAKQEVTAFDSAEGGLVKRLLVSGALVLIALPAGASGIAGVQRTSSTSFSKAAADAAEDAAADPAEDSKIPESQKQMQDALDKFSGAWNVHDGKAMAATYENTGTFINPAGHVAKGKTAIQDLFIDEQAGMLKDTTHAELIEQTRMMGKNAALVDVAIQVTGMKAADGSALPVQNFHGVYLMKRKNEDKKAPWKILDGRVFMTQPMPPKTGSL
jgi:uncharacterized protein (TIGR02246 family)